MERVSRIQTEIDNGITPADTVLLQHARDLTSLMEQAWEVYLDTRNELALEHARRRLCQRDTARRLLSKDWIAQREAEIQAACGVAFFIDQGDKDRAQIAANEEG